jgi:Holliday junction DNA helicase RuvB
MGATTKAGKVSGPLHSRFGISIRMDFYTNEEIVRIIQRSAGILGVAVADDAARLLAECSRGTPRVANRLLRRMRDFAQVVGEGNISRTVVSDGLQRLEIDSYGLERHDREILRVIAETYGGGPVGAETLAISVGEAAETLEDFYEPYLIQRGFLKRTPRGRMVTELAYKHLALNKRNNEDQELLF